MHPDLAIGGDITEHERTHHAINHHLPPA
jgi:hypothetical protein